MGAPKGNQNAVGNNGGRPPIHTDPDHVETLIQDYFEWIKGEFEEKEVEYRDEEGNLRKAKEVKTIRHSEPPTITGLSLHIGFNSKTTLYEYADKVEFSNPIKRAISRIEKHHEIAIAYGDKCTGNIFALKNFGWRDKVDHDITSGGNPLDNTMKIQVMDYSEDDDPEAE